MNIRAKLRLLTIISIGVILLVTGTLVITTRQYNQAARENEVANEINRHLVELGLLTTDYVLHNGRRAEQQWHRKHDQLVALIATAHFATPADRASSDRIGRSLADMHVTFEGLGKLSDDAQVNETIATELKRRYTGQLGTRAQAIASDAAHLARDSTKRIQVIRQRRVVIFVCSVLLVAGYMIGTAIVFDRGIVRPLHRLHKGTEVIGSGRLDYKVGTPVQDEIGQLSRAFDDMTDRLQQITVSRDDLAAEVEQRKRVEAELARSNTELEQFAYVASHDLQEPLRMVTSYLQLIVERYHGQLDKDGTEFIGYAVDGAARMRTLIRDLLEYSRVGRRSKPFAATDCAAVLQTVLANLQASIQETGAHVHIGRLPVVWGDAGELTQLFQNLMGNAIKFHGDVPPEVNVTATARDGEWLFQVSDNGIGIDPQYAERLFVIFQRLHSREKYPGTGIGLAICKKIVLHHHGRIWMESQPGQGATFFFTLPKTNQEYEWP